MFHSIYSLKRQVVSLIERNTNLRQSLNANFEMNIVLFSSITTTDHIINAKQRYCIIASTRNTGFNHLNCLEPFDQGLNIHIL